MYPYAFFKGIKLAKPGLRFLRIKYAKAFEYDF